MDVNEEEGVVHAQPRTLAERQSIARKCCESLKLTIPCVVDDEHDSADTAYAAWPERIYIVGTNGRIAYAGEQGPWGFKTRPVERWIRKNAGTAAK